MSFDVTTFIFEIVNFLVLVWLLHRFLYRPVLGVIDRRRARIEQQIAEAREQREQAAALEQQYQERLTGWAREREQAKADLQAEMQKERDAAMSRLRAELAQERERQAALHRQSEAERLRQAERDALTLALSFTARLLQRLADPALEAGLVRVALADLAALPAEQRQGIAQALRNHGGPVVVATAFSLPQALRDTVREALEAVTEAPLEITFTERADLVAGLRISGGHWELSANVAEELKFFEEAGHAGNGSQTD